MIGRGVFANPYCFTDHSPTREELIKLLKLHRNLYEEYKKNHPFTPYDPLKHFFKIYINNFPGAKDIRAKLMETHSVEEAHQIIDQL